MFEFHVTIQCELSQFPQFQEVCQTLSVKPLAIYLASDKNNYHIMTSSILISEDVEEALKELSRIVTGLSNYKILREKIEASPNVVFSSKLDYEYYETHVELNNIVTELPKELSLLWAISNNFNKPDRTILTYRSTSLEDQGKMQKDYDYLLDNNHVTSIQPILFYEFAILDSNPSLDSNWIN